MAKISDQQQPPPPAPANVPRVQVYGDSIAEGIGSLYGIEGTEQTTKIGSGFNVREDKRLVSAGTLRRDPSGSTIVSIGWNDTPDMTEAGVKAYADKVAQRLREIIKQTGNSNIALLELGYTNATNNGSRDAQVATNKALQIAMDRVNAEQQPDGKPANIHLVNTEAAAGERAKDGLHYNAKGYQTIFEAAQRELGNPITPPQPGQSQNMPPGPIENNRQPGNQPPGSVEDQQRRRTTAAGPAPANTPPQDPLAALLNGNEFLKELMQLLAMCFQKTTDDHQNPGDKLAAAGATVANHNGQAPSSNAPAVDNAAVAIHR